MEKRVGSLSGGEATRLVFSRLMVQKPNVLVLDEPTNHLDLEAIEALVSALSSYEGTLVFVSHDRWFVSQLATRVIEILPDGLNDFPGTYQEYIERQGDDHLDADQVALRAKRDKKTGAAPARRAPMAQAKSNRARELPKRLDAVLAEISSLEAKKAEISQRYCQPGFFDATPPDEIARLEREQNEIDAKVAELTAEWEALEAELAAQA